MEIVYFAKKEVLQAFLECDAVVNNIQHYYAVVYDGK